MGAPCRRCSIPNGASAGHEHRVRRVRRRWRLHPTRVLGRGGMALALHGGGRAPGLLATRRERLERPPVRPMEEAAAISASDACELARGECLVSLGGPAAAERGGMGIRCGGRTGGWGQRRQTYLSLGRYFGRRA